MNVRLVGYTKAVPLQAYNAIDAEKELCEKCGITYIDPLEVPPQEFIAFCARVSNPANQMNTESSDRLISYLIKHKHWSPLEMVNVVLEVKTTRDIARQLLRHRSFSFQEFSQRYADISALISEFQPREARLQDKKDRQNSIDVNDTDLENEWNNQQREVWDAAIKAYRWAIENGVAKEQARVVLPEGLTASKLYVNGTLRSWVHYIELRTKKSTQKEHRLMAVECAKAIAAIFPLVNDFVEKTDA